MDWEFPMHNTYVLWIWGPLILAQTHPCPGCWAFWIHRFSMHPWDRCVTMKQKLLPFRKTFSCWQKLSIDVGIMQVHMWVFTCGFPNGLFPRHFGGAGNGARITMEWDPGLFCACDFLGLKVSSEVCKYNLRYKWCIECWIYSLVNVLCSCEYCVDLIHVSFVCVFLLACVVLLSMWEVILIAYWL